MTHRPQDQQQQTRDLYTIPISARWFNWDSIHDTERRSLPEFFDSSSYSRSPRVYKEYRDFIINKFREDPSRRLTFTEVRRSLIGDVGSVEKVFSFLDRWGLINFGVAKGEEDKEKGMVVVEEGPPVGMKVVMASAAGKGGGGGEGVIRLPALSSYRDVFGEEGKGKKGTVCGVCGEQCGSDRVDSGKGGETVCSKCFETKNKKEDKPADDLKPKSNVDGSDNHVNNAWTDTETLLLLEAVLKHADDWDLIAQHVRTKNKVECIARLIHLPFGEHMLSPIRSKLDNGRSYGGDINKSTQQVIRKQLEGPIKVDGELHTDTDEKKDITVEETSPACPTKKRCLPSLSNVTDSLTEQVALLSTIVGPHIATVGAEAAVAALCHENPCAQKAFQVPEDELPKSFGVAAKDELESNSEYEDRETKRHKQTEKSFGATTFRIRAAIATALGATAARAKLLADQESREMELLMASIIEMQLKKINIKMKHFEELEVIMEKEYSQIQQLKESILEEWVGILQQATNAGIPRWKNNGLPKLLLNTNS